MSAAGGMGGPRGGMSAMGMPPGVGSAGGPRGGLPALPQGGSGNGPRGGLPGIGDEPGQPMGQDTNIQRKKGVVYRTEFIILFIWKEPTPSDALLPPDEAPAAPAGGGMMMPGGRGGAGMAPGS
jgi:hypothetical protein